MTAKELAQKLNGCEYGNELTREDEQMAKASGLVVVFGYSDDNCEFRGAINDEEGCFDGGTIYLNKYGAIIHLDDFPEGYQGKLREIKAVWCDPKVQAAWLYKTDIPHETFHVYEDGELYCVGIVFRLEDLTSEKEMSMPDYDKLVKDLREADEISMCGECGYKGDKKGPLFAEAADAIEKLQRLVEANNTSRWISVEERLPEEFVSVQAHMTDAGPLPSVREAYLAGGKWFFPALNEYHPVDKWAEFSELHDHIGDVNEMVEPKEET